MYSTGGTQITWQDWCFLAGKVIDEKQLHVSVMQPSKYMLSLQISLWMLLLLNSKYGVMKKFSKPKFELQSMWNV